MKIYIALSAIKLSDYKKWGGHNVGDKNFFKVLFEKYSKKKNPFRIYLPILGHGKYVPQKIKIPYDIENYLIENDYLIEDYFKGIVSKDKGKRVIKIGKVLKDRPDLLDMYQKHKAKAGPKDTSDIIVVISRHPYDIAGMSTGRGWHSCTNLGIGIGDEEHHKQLGMHYDSVIEDVKNNNLIAYAIRTDDTNIKNPIARVRISKYNNHKNGDFFLKRHGKVYTNDVRGFRETVDAWLDEVNVVKGGLYSLTDDVYDDGDDMEHYVAPNSDIDRLRSDWKHNVIQPKHKADIVLNVPKRLNKDDIYDLVVEDIGQSKVSTRTANYTHGIMRNVKADPELLHRIAVAYKFGPEVNPIIDNPNLPEKTLRLFLEDEDVQHRIKLDALVHPNLSTSYLDKYYFSTDDIEYKKYILRSDHVSEKVCLDAMESDKLVVACALFCPHKNVLLKLLHHKDNVVRLSLTSNDNITTEMLKTMLKEEQSPHISAAIYEHQKFDMSALTLDTVKGLRKEEKESLCVNSSVTEKVLDYIVDSTDDWEILNLVVKTNRATDSIFYKIIQKKDGLSPEVSFEVTRPVLQTKNNIAKSDIVSEHTLSLLCLDKHSTVRLNCVENENAGELVYAALQDDMLVKIKRVVAKRTKNIGILRKYTELNVNSIISNMLENKFVVETPEFIIPIIENAAASQDGGLWYEIQEIKIPPKILEKMVNSKEDQVRVLVAEKTTNVFLLGILSKDTSSYVRRRVAENKYTPAKILENIATDSFARQLGIETSDEDSDLLYDESMVQRAVRYNEKTPIDFVTKNWKET